jgi:hypothetical protein
VRGINPIDALTSSTVIVPSSTRTPDGSVTINSLASGMSVTWVVNVTELGGVVRVDPLMGEVVINEFADALIIPR